MRLLCVLLTALASQHAAAAKFDCFTVVDPGGEVVYKSNRTPIDLSKNISDVMAATYPRHHLIWSQTDEACVGVDRLPARDGTTGDARPTGASTATDAPVMPGRKTAAAAARRALDRSR